MPRRIVLVLAAVALAGCSGAAPAATGPVPATSTTRSSTPPPTPTGLAAMPVADALDAVTTALARSRGVRVTGTVTQKQETVSVDVHLVRGRGGRGTVSPPDSTMQVIVIGTTVYLSGDRRFLTKAVGARNVAKFRGKYAPGTTAKPLMAQLAVLFDLVDYASLLPTGGLRPGAAGTSAGTPTLTFTDGHGGRLVVADRPEPVPLRYTGETGRGPVDLTFAYEEPVTLAAPPRSKLITG